MAACGAPGAGKENGGDGNSQNETPEPAERITPAAGSTGATQRRRRHGEERPEPVEPGVRAQLEDR